MVGIEINELDRMDGEYLLVDRVIQEELIVMRNKFLGWLAENGGGDRGIVMTWVEGRFEHQHTQDLFKTYLAGYFKHQSEHDSRPTRIYQRLAKLLGVDVLGVLQQAYNGRLFMGGALDKHEVNVLLHFDLLRGQGHQWFLNDKGKLYAEILIKHNLELTSKLNDDLEVIIDE